MYENLLRLPYFQGMSKKELTAILDKVKFEFTRYKDGDKIFKQGDKCDKFVILIQGKVSAEHKFADSTSKLNEQLEAPYAIEPYSLYGCEPNFGRSYTSLGECSLLSISKSYFYSEFIKHSIFTMNLLNLISHRVQLQNTLSWLDTPKELEGLIARFIATRSETQYGSKTLKIKMEFLAAQLGATRINISKALNKLKEKGYIELSRGEIRIPKFESLIAAVWETAKVK